MLSKCSNPECSHQFHYLHEGKLFRFDVSTATNVIGVGLRSKRTRRIEFFWLCDDCAKRWTVIRGKSGGIELEPLNLQSKAS